MVEAATPRPLRPRREVDYRSAGLGAADEPAWLQLKRDEDERHAKANAAAASKAGARRAVEDAENVNPQRPASSPPARRRSRRDKQAVTGAEAAPGAPPRSAPERLAVGRNVKEAGGKRKAKSMGGGGEAARVPKRQVPEPAEEAAPAPVDQPAGPRKTRSSASGGSKPGGKPASTPEGCTGSLNALADAAETAAQKLSGAGAGVGAIRSKGKAAAEPELVEAKGKGKSAHKVAPERAPRPATRGRNAGLIVEDLDEGRVAPRLAPQTAKPAATEAPPAPPIRAAKAGKAAVSPPKPARPEVVKVALVNPLPLSQFEVPELPELPELGTEPAGGSPSQEEAPQPPPGASSVAFLRLYDSYMALQEKYSSLKDGKLKELEKQLEVDMKLVDAHVKAAAELAAHWRAEAEQQARLAQEAGAPELQRELEGLRVEVARERRGRIEAEVLLREAERGALVAQHALERSEARAAAAEEARCEALARAMRSTADAAAQTEAAPACPPASQAPLAPEAEAVMEEAEGQMEEVEEVPPTQEAEGLAAAPAVPATHPGQGSPGEQGSRDMGHSACGQPAPASAELRQLSQEKEAGEAVGQVGDAMETQAVEEYAEEEEEEEIIVLEVCLNTEEGGAGRMGATPCSVRRRRPADLGRAFPLPLSPWAHTPCGPVRVVFTRPSAPAAAGLDSPAAAAATASPAVRNLGGALAASVPSPLGLCELVNDAEAVLKESQPQSHVQELGAQDAEMADTVVEDGGETGAAEAADFNKAVDWVPLQLLTDFKSAAGSRPGFVSYLHPPSGLHFELGPAESGGSAMDSDLGSDEEEIAYVPVNLGRAADIMPEHLQDEITFAASGKHYLFCTVLDALGQLQPRKQRKS
eukprot:jgi/Tetstr1/425138/TSEL_015600.t1